MCFVKFFGWYESLDANTIFIAMEYFKYGDLQRHLKSPLVENEAQQIMMQLLEGLVFMHDNGFAHRDLKPAVGVPCVDSVPVFDWRSKCLLDFLTNLGDAEHIRCFR